MSDDEVYSSEEESEEEVSEEEEETPAPKKEEEHKAAKHDEPKAEENIFTHRPQVTTSELDEQLKEYIAEWRKQRSKEEDELKALREKQSKRKVLRAEEDKRLAAAKKVEDERRLREEQERKQRELEERRKRLEEAEKKRKLLEQASGATAGGKLKISRSEVEVGSTGPTKVIKTREQLEEEKKLAMSVRIKQLKTEGLGLETLKKKADDLWTCLVQLQTDKYDLEERQKRQDYDLKELKERQKMQLRHKAVRLGLEPEALTGKHPPKIQTASKFERTIDRRTYVDKKDLFSGGFDGQNKDHLEKEWKEKYDEWDKRSKSRLPKWFGERPGKKADDPETPVEEEKEEELVPPPQEIEEPEEEEEEEEEESEEEEEEEEEEE